VGIRWVEAKSISLPEYATCLAIARKTGKFPGFRDNVLLKRKELFAFKPDNFPFSAFVPPGLLAALSPSPRLRLGYGLLFAESFLFNPTIADEDAEPEWTMGEKRVESL
jgi:hypothetical protein